MLSGFYGAFSPACFALLGLWLVVVLIRAGGTIGLLAGGQLRPWSFQGYAEPDAGGLAEVADVLTPPSTVAVIAAGYRPMLHPSAAPGVLPPSTLQQRTLR